MNTSTTPAKKLDTKVLLSTLWIVVMINMLKADILGGFIPGALEEVEKTAVSVGASVPQLMLGGAVMGQLGIAMILLSRVLDQRVNRWANIIVSIITIAYIWGGMSTYPHYLFIASVETLCLLFILWTAWKWRGAEIESQSTK
ncbi:DUF6326 family protein [Levilinea saccharolytica]|uniref:Uncharacterized protein n=1 Tax=Levilinea saccharolytica TaxID=229921 RepID=A0A0P6XVH8_9CHLR|nr:DUF6326 family protein [Levilinea saccharolytica]KPL77460.1 hypothetical protein ADN01_16360 [Levilinea saccharolytica]GAP18832.1 hypothetical protein LSAC_02730 [Levilinea saccharolytica]